VSGPATVAWLCLGANIGRRGAALQRLRDLLDQPPLRLAAASRELVTRPLGVLTQPDFLNQVLRVESDRPMEPAEWLSLCRSAETAAGRRPTYHWGPRRADADILLLGPRGELRVDTVELVVPHPELPNRAFACALLAELAPELTHPDGWRFADRAGVFAPISATDPPTAGSP
jgi:2-amino-4-hydroxy-6-hydroxymethyldihydropteridine diphosphokinase